MNGERKLSGAITALSLFAVRAESDYSILSTVWKTFGEPCQYIPNQKSNF